MTRDIVRELGLLTLGTRLRRVGEKVQLQSQHIMDELGVPLQAAQYPFVAALVHSGPLTIGELAHAVGITQPGATRTVSQLVSQGVFQITQSEADQRVRLVSFTQKGTQIAEHAKAVVWPRIQAAVFELCGNASGGLLQQLADIEDGLNEKPLTERGVNTKGAAS